MLRHTITGNEFRDSVAHLAQSLALGVTLEHPLGQRLWGANRVIDLYISHSPSRRQLGIECKIQSNRGSAEQKLIATLEDIKLWPIPGIIVYDGHGFSPHFESYLRSTRSAIPFENLDPWLRNFFHF